MNFNPRWDSNPRLMYPRQVSFPSMKSVIFTIFRAPSPGLDTILFIYLIIKYLFQVGRIEPTIPKYFGHSGPVVDLKWSPFDDTLIASASDDSTVRTLDVSYEVAEMSINKYQSQRWNTSLSSSTADKAVARPRTRAEHRPLDALGARTTRVAHTALLTARVPSGRR